MASLGVFMDARRKRPYLTPDCPDIFKTHIGVGYTMMKVEQRVF